MRHQHVNIPRWIAGLMKCRWCQTISINVFPDDLMDIECGKCGRQTGITYARIRRRNGKSIPR